MRTLFAVVALSVPALLASAAPARAGAPYVDGQYVTPTVQGTIKFTPVKAVIQFGYQGTFVINGKRQPGVLYFIRGTTDVGLLWYYGTTGIPAGSAVVSPVGGTTYAGDIEFTNRQGAVTDAGVVVVDIVSR